MFDIERLVVAFFVGALLGQSGSLIQGVTQNRLAGPSTLGMIGPAVVLVLCAHFLIEALSLSYYLEHLSLILSMIFWIVLFIFIRKDNTKLLSNQAQSSAGRYIMIGLCFNLFIGAVFNILQFIFMTTNKKFPTELWFGGLKYLPPGSLILTFLMFALSFVYLYQKSSTLWALSFGEDFALSLGITPGQTQKKALMLAFLVTLFLTSYFGVFPFMGLIFPHILRRISYFRKNHKNELLQGALICGFLFAIFDAICYNFTFSGAEIPVGMLSSVIGTLVLMILMAQTRKSFFYRR